MEWLEWQESLHFTAIELGLDRCLSVAEKLELLVSHHAVISVAGTNGKGSSVKMLELILRASGYKTGCYTSPHLVRYNERIQISGEEVSDDKLCESFNRIDRARGDISLTYFEFGTLAALDIIQHAEVDVAILEVGLGGRLDAVNCVDADASLVTSIDIDHVNWLGADRESIGREKAGIYRTSTPAICSDPNPPESLLKCAESLGASLFLHQKNYNYQVYDDSWTWHSDKIKYDNLPKPSLYNDSQIQNAAGVLMLLNTLKDRFKVDSDAIRKGMQEFKLAGRFQVVPDNAQIVLDVAHNRQAANVLVKNLKQLPITGKTHILIGMLKDKDHIAIFKELANITDAWHIVTLDDIRGCDSLELASKLRTIEKYKPIACYNNIPEALDYIRSIVKPKDRVVVTGSFLSVGAAINLLNLQH
jgi:dihydrofolate synthase/folylpolyglutamate synthase